MVKTNKKEMTSGKRKKRTAVYIIAVILVSFLLSLLMMFLVNDAFSLTAVSGQTVVILDRDQSLYKASKTLKKEGLIDSRLWFILYAELRGKNKPVKEGRYVLQNTGGFDGILSAFQ